MTHIIEVSTVSYLHVSEAAFWLHSPVSGLPSFEINPLWCECLSHNFLVTAGVPGWERKWRCVHDGTAKTLFPLVLTRVGFVVRSWMFLVVGLNGFLSERYLLCFISVDRTMFFVFLFFIRSRHHHDLILKNIWYSWIYFIVIDFFSSLQFCCKRLENDSAVEKILLSLSAFTYLISIFLFCPRNT